MRVFTSALIIMMLAVPYLYAEGARKTIPCEEAVKNSSRVKVWMTESEVLELMGSPGKSAGGSWSYVFECAKLPPAAGETVITGMDIYFSEGAVREVRFAWVDATGMRMPVKQRGRRKKRRH